MNGFKRRKMKLKAVKIMVRLYGSASKIYREEGMP